MAVAASRLSTLGPASFDSSVIEGFAGIMDAEAIYTLLRDMERDVRKRILRLSDMRVVSGSLKAIAQDAHDVRSLGGNFGMTALAARAGEVERAARAGALEDVRATLPSLITAGDQALAILAARPELRNGTKR